MPSLARNIFDTVLGTAFFHACQLAVFCLLARFATPDDFGRFQYCLALAQPVILFCGLELRGALVSDVSNKYAPITYYRLRVRMLTLGAALLLVIGIARALWRPHEPFLLLFCAIVAARLIWSLGEVGWALFQRREQHRFLGGANVYRGLAYLAPFALLLPMATGGNNAVAASPLVISAAAWLNALGWLAVWRLYDVPRLGPWTGPDKPEPLRPLLIDTLPLGFTQLVIMLCDALPRMVLEAQPRGSAQLAYYGAMAYVTQIGNLVVLQAGTAAANRLSLYYASDRPRFLKLLLRLCGGAAIIGVLVFAVAVYYGRFFLRVLYGAEYRAFHYEFVIIVFAHCLTLMTAVIGITITQMRIFWLQAPLQVLILAATTVAAFILIPPDPLRGAAWTNVIRAVVHLALYAACLAYFLSRRNPTTRPPAESYG